MKRIRDIFGHPIALMILLVSILFFILNSFNLANAGTLFDTTLFYFIAGISGITALFMLVRTKWDDWTLLGAGLLGHFLAVGFVYFLSVWYITHPIESYTPELLVLARSVLIISGLFVINGIIKEFLEDMGFHARDVWKVIRQPKRTLQTWKDRKK